LTEHGFDEQTLGEVEVEEAMVVVVVGASVVRHDVDTHIHL